MSYIYKIINDINDKIYIGKTVFSIDKRFKEHCCDAFKQRNKERPLYKAMREYGIEHFYIELIEECDDNLASDREIYWIGLYNTYSNGYNATYGGDGKFLYNYKNIAMRLKEHPYSFDISKEFNCCVEIIREIAQEYNIKLKSYSPSSSKHVVAYTKDGEKIEEFDSTVLASQWCFEQGKCADLCSGVRAHISACANGKRKTAYGYIWKYED